LNITNTQVCTIIANSKEVTLVKRKPLPKVRVIWGRKEARGCPAIVDRKETHGP
jgi:hypothetical protein